MPRQPDPGLEVRILNAAHALWKRGGEKALTMRAVAKSARSNTPALYRRFKNRKDIVGALLRRIQADLGLHLRRCRTVEEIGEVYLGYALAHPHEYELMRAHIRELAPPTRDGKSRPLRETRPNMGLLENKLAERLGGAPEDHTRLALAQWAVAHGTAMILIDQAIPPEHEAELRAAFAFAVRALLREASSLSAKR